jgi:predicted Zn finger-like uncharacterized protein
MYTKCPDCDTAFRVTARDLGRASGRVICIGCSREFNALESLSEDPPAAVEMPDSRKLILESLEELTGPHEIRIEDTGVEWRVIEDDLEDDKSAADDDAVDHESSTPRWYIADIETPGSEAGMSGGVADSAHPETADPGGTRDAAGDKPVEPVPRDAANQQEPLQLPATGDTGEVQRYDDNTPLPDDFVDESELRVPQRRAEDRIQPRSPEADEAQVDLALGEPDDWKELLDEVGPPPGDPAREGSRTATAGGASTGGPPPADEALAETDVRPMTAEDEEFDVDDGYPSDIDTQFDLQAIELGIDLTGSRNLSLENGDDPGGNLPGLPAAGGGPRVKGPEEEPNPTAAEYPPGTDEAAPLPEADITARHRVAGGAAGAGTESDAWQDSADQDARDAAEGPEDPEDKEQRDRDQAFEDELAAAYSVSLADEETDSSGEAARAGPVAPPATEHELTTNLLIDQDLIRLAEQHPLFESPDRQRRSEDVPHVETIIMEGDFVQNVTDGDFFDTGAGRYSGTAAGAGANSRTAAVTDDDDVLLETFVRNKGRVRGRRRRTDPPGYAIMAGVAVLSLLLAAQVVHAYRETLVRYEFFDRTVGSVYRILGEPVIPEWTVKEWRFEATSGSTDDTEEILTISSRIANGFAKPLPYPLLHVSLTDRWEEIIGSKVLEPAEYLAEGTDPAGRVDPGENFTALIRVEEPAPEATGFKLNVCYPESGGRVRCATEDFRD